MSHQSCTENICRQVAITTVTDNANNHSIRIFFCNFTEAHTAPPEDVPALIPSSRAKRRAVFPLQFAEYP